MGRVGSCASLSLPRPQYHRWTASEFVYKAADGWACPQGDFAAALEQRPYNDHLPISTWPTGGAEGMIPDLRRAVSRAMASTC